MDAVHFRGRVKAFLERPIDGDWPYLWIDATYMQVRENGRIVSVAVIVAVEVNSDGRREVLGPEIGPSQAETFAFLRKLARRGLRGVKLVISGDHEGIKAAVSKVLSTAWDDLLDHCCDAWNKFIHQPWHIMTIGYNLVRLSALPSYGPPHPQHYTSRTIS